MDSTFVWIVMFAGAAVALLGVFLVASERELKAKRREIESLLAKLENSPQGSTPTQSIQPEAAQAEIAGLRAQSQNLQNQLSALTNDLDQSRNTIADLRSSQQHSASSQIENEQLSMANERLQRELTQLQSQLTATEAQISLSRSLNDPDGNARMQAEINNLRATLNESHTKIRDLENARQNLPDVNAIAAIHNQERDALRQHISELESRVSMDQEKHAELQTARDRLAEAQSMQNSLRDEIRRHEAEIPRWQARIAAADENRQRLAALQVPCNELLSKQAALADRQRQLQDDLVAFARQIAAATEGTERLSSPAQAASAGDAAANISPQEATAKSNSSDSFSSLRGNNAAPELRAAQEVAMEPTGDVAPAGPTGRRYGILGMLLISAATVTLGFQLFIADSEQTSNRAATANPIQTSAPPAPLPERAAEPRPPAGVRRNPTAYATARGSASQTRQ
jgi:chromosome segregation ATPase